MIRSNSNLVLSVGEAMVEMAPIGDHRYQQGFAGDTFNTIWHMRHLLGDDFRTGFVTRIGTDTFSDRFAAEMTADGLDPVGVGRDPERIMGLYVIELAGAERSFHYWRSDSAARRLADDAAALKQMFGEAALIHLSGITLAILAPEARDNLFAALAAARYGGTVVSFDPNIRMRLWPSKEAARETLGRMLTMTDIALPSFDDEAALWGDGSPDATITRMRAAGIGEIVVKDGAGPVHYATCETRHHCDTPVVSQLVDTTGAGDSFNAGYLAARLAGAMPVEAIAAGQMVSATVIGCLGARAPKQQMPRLQASIARSAGTAGQSRTAST